MTFQQKMAQTNNGLTSELRSKAKNKIQENIYKSRMGNHYLFGNFVEDVRKKMLPARTAEKCN